MNETLKLCARCKEWVHRTNFTKHAAQYDGLSSYCRPCKSILHAEWRAKRSPEVVARDLQRSRLSPDMQADPRLRVLYNRQNHLRKHGLTPEMYLEMLDSQGGGCGSCGTTEPGGRYGRFAVDHDHRCCPGEFSCGNCVRGLLCITCNITAGHLESERSVCVIEYLRRTNVQ